METFNFCPERYVPETLPRDPVSGMSMNGWNFSARPTTPYQRRFKLTLFGLRWYLNGAGRWDVTTDPFFNARRLEEFYEAHETWNPFHFEHQHFGPLVCRFSAAVVIPKGEVNSGGQIAPVEIQLVHHNPGY